MLIDSKRHFLVINNAFWFKDFSREVVNFLNSRLHGVKYIGICHDRDVNENNEFKTIHIHLYLEFPKKVTTQKIIREFNEYLGIDAGYLISDMSVYSVTSCVRYLLHLDDIDKYQYRESDLFYSDINMLELLNKNIDTLDIETLYDIISASKNLLQVYSRVGLNLASRYRNIINDIWNNRKILNDDE